MDKTIHYNDAIYWTAPEKKEVDHTQQSREAILQEICDTHLECLDARDINYYAAEVDLPPNEVRNMMIQPDSKDENQNFLSVLHSFDNDETDNIIDYF